MQRNECILTFDHYLRSGTCFIAAACLALSGCNKSPYDLAPVHGSVLVDGKPLVRASIMFAPEVAGNSVNSGKPAFGQLDGEGCFILGTYEAADGAIVGDHTVTISRRSSQASIDSATEVAASGPEFRSILVPGRFHVTPGQNEITITLSTEEFNRYARFDR